MAASESATIIEDLKDERVPPALYWTTEQVAEWIEELGFPHYKVALSHNYVQIFGGRGEELYLSGSYVYIPLVDQSDARGYFLQGHSKNCSAVLVSWNMFI